MFSLLRCGQANVHLARILAFSCTLFITVPSLEAEPIPGRWEKAELLEPESSVTVLLISGETIEGTFEGIEGGAFLLRAGRRTLTIEKRSIYRVTKSYVEKPNPARGALWGLAAGAAFGGILAATDGSAGFVSDPGGSGFTGTIRSGGNEWEKKGALVAGSAAVGCLLGFLIDVSVDPMEVQQEVIFQAP